MSWRPLSDSFSHTLEIQKQSPVRGKFKIMLPWDSNPFSWPRWWILPSQQLQVELKGCLRQQSFHRSDSNATDIDWKSVKVGQEGTQSNLRLNGDLSPFLLDHSTEYNLRLKRDLNILLLYWMTCYIEWPCGKEAAEYKNLRLAGIQTHLCY